MATKRKIAEIIASIKAIYPYYAKENDIKITAKIWELTLNKYPDEVIDISFLKCLQTCKVPPTPADIIEQINAMAETNEQTDEELWAVLTRALRQTNNLVYYFQFNAIQANGKTQGDNARAKVTALWDGLPERLQNYIGSKGELIRIAQTYTDEELKYEKTRFLKTMPTIKKREEYTGLKALLSDERLLIGD